MISCDTRMSLDWKKMTIQQLKAELKKHGLDENGRKGDLIDRLEKHVTKGSTKPAKPAVVPRSIFDEPSDSDSEADEEEQGLERDQENQADSIALETKSDSICASRATTINDLANSDKEPDPTNEQPPPSHVKTEVRSVIEIETKSTKSDIFSNENHLKTDEGNDSDKKPDAEQEPSILDGRDVSNLESTINKLEPMKKNCMEIKKENHLEQVKTTKEEMAKALTDTATPKDDELKCSFSSSGEFIKSNGSEKWIDIIDCTNSDNILQELKKIGKVQAFKNRQKDHEEIGRKHKIRIFPISIEDVTSPLIKDIVNRAKLCNLNFGLVEKDGRKFGWLMAVFKTRAEVLQTVEAFKKQREDLKVYYSSGDKSDKETRWQTEWAKFVNNPDVGEMNIFRLFVPSLPQTLTEEEMWNIFPTARDIILVDATPCKHAYIHFWNEKAGRMALDDLNARGPPRDDFCFCRLINQADLIKLISSTSGTDNKQATKRGESTARTNQNATKDSPQKRPQHKFTLEARGKPKNLMNIHLRRRLGSGRRLCLRQGSRIKQTPCMMTSHDREDATNMLLQDTFAQLQTQNIDMPWINQPEPGCSQGAAQSFQPAMTQSRAPKPLMETTPDWPSGRGQASPVHLNQGQDVVCEGNLKRPLSSADMHIGTTKRLCDRRGNLGRGHQNFNNIGQVPGQCDPQLNTPTVDDYQSSPDPSQECSRPPEIRQGSNQWISYNNKRPSSCHLYNVDSEQISGDHHYSDGFQRREPHSDNQYRPSGVYGNKRPLLPQPDQDYRALEQYTDRSASATASRAFTIKQLKDSLSMPYPRLPVEKRQPYRSDSYY